MHKMLETMLHEVEALPEEEQRRIARVLEEEVHRARRAAAQPRGRWARLAERLSRESPLEGESEEFLRRAREFRDGFLFVEPKSAD